MDANKIAENLMSLEDIHFPTLPDTLVKIQKVLENPKYTDRELASAITNPSTLIRLLQVANSSAFGAKDVSTAEAAIRIVGSNLARNIVLCMSIHDLFSNKMRAVFKHRLECLWTHSVGIASMACLLAPRFNLNPVVALNAGLLHDIGMLPVVHYFEKNQLDSELFDNVSDLISAKLGREILTRWNFPFAIINATDSSRFWPATPVSYFDIVSSAHFLESRDLGRLEPLNLIADDIDSILNSAAWVTQLKSLGY